MTLEEACTTHSDADNTAEHYITGTPSTATSSISSPPSANTTPSRTRDASSSVQVAVRIRPLLASEAGNDVCIRVFPPVNHGDHAVALQIGGSQGPRFTFDQVFDQATTQDQLYQSRVQPLVDSCLAGYNATIFAYGQTGSGKTHSIMGEHLNPGNPGIIPRALEALFQAVNLETTTIRIQFLEVYGEEIRDLLVPTHSTISTNKLTIRDIDDEPEVVGATQRLTCHASEALLALTHGMLRRVTGATAMNSSSSRSHAILSVMIEQQQPVEVESTGSHGDSHRPQRVSSIVSKFHFVDLAGSERQKRTKAEGQRLKEGISINKGLLVLGNVISALGDPKKSGSFVPYRDSKLTRLLKGSLGGNHKTLMIACVSPSASNLDESLNCLRYANRAKNIQNNAHVNVDPTSRVIAQLKYQVQLLAANLLHAMDGQSAALSMTREQVKSLVNGHDEVTGSFRADRADAASSTASSVDHTRRLEVELSRTRDALREARTNQDSAEQELYQVKAKVELLQLQLESSSGTLSGEDKKNEDSLQALFVQQAAAYEARIGKLQQQLQQAESRVSHLHWMVDNDPQVEANSIAKAKNALEEDRQRLAELEEGFDMDEKGDEIPIASLSPESHQLEQKEAAEEAHLNVLTQKYLGDDVEDFMDAEEENEHDETVANVENVNQSNELSAAKRKRADLIELSRSIAAKEDLINQLQLSQDKYAGMRDFYEERLKQMEDSLQDRVSERDHIQQEINQRQSQGHATPNAEVQARLQEKEQHIVTLQKKLKELKKMSNLLVRNNDEITRLKNEVHSMKWKKVELQKQIGHERKLHATEKRHLQKNAMQKDKEINKLLVQSNQRETQARKAAEVAKAKLNEVGHKYKEAEKKLRVLSVKRGMMLKAGLDPVLVGRKTWKPNHQRLTQPARKEAASVNPDSLRDLFDKKVAHVVRKEATVDKLAHEWEEHFELTSRRQQMMESDQEQDAEAIQSLAVQIGFKEERIRQFASRLSKQVTSEDSQTPGVDSVLFGRDFSTLCSDVSPEHSKETAAKVLFGMVVRERRRVAALARTASSLDERAQLAEKEAAAKEEAYRSYMIEQRRELAALTQSQQEQILSLMDIVKSSPVDPADNRADIAPCDNPKVFGSKLLVLANERIGLLEQQLEALRVESNELGVYRERSDELQAELAEVTRDKGELEEEVSSLRSTLRQIRDMVAGSRGKVADDMPDDAYLSLIEFIRDALHPRAFLGEQSRTTPRNKDSLNSSPHSLRKCIEQMQASEIEDEEETPEWAADIMADLALITQGTPPPWIQLDSEEAAALNIFPTSHSFNGCDSVSHMQSDESKDQTLKADSPQRGKAGRRAMSEKIAQRLDQIVVPGRDSGDQKETRSDAKQQAFVHPPKTNEGRKGVFERLASPSHYTGIHKERYQASHQQSTKQEAFRQEKKRPPLMDSTSAQLEELLQNEPPPDASSILLEELLQSDSDVSRRSSTVNSRRNSSTDLPQEEKATRATVPDYNQMNVFERLNRTTTRAYEVKLMESDVYHEKVHSSSSSGMRSGPVHHEGKDDSGAPTIAHAVGVGATGTVNHSDYTSVDVFTRLQQTKTEAFANKVLPDW